MLSIVADFPCAREIAADYAQGTKRANDIMTRAVLTGLGLLRHRKKQLAGPENSQATTSADGLIPGCHQQCATWRPSVHRRGRCTESSETAPVRAELPLTVTSLIAIRREGPSWDLHR